MKKQLGVTLVEILIALAIMATVAVFTIPKVMNAAGNTTNDEHKRRAKQAASMIQAAYSQYKLNNRKVDVGMKSGDLTPYLNYVAITTIGSVDGGPQNSGFYNCQTDVICMKLQNGAILYYSTAALVDPTSSTSGFWFQIDPDGKALEPLAVDATTKSVGWVLYVNGKLLSMAKMMPNTYVGTTIYQPNSTYDPSWFSWN